MTMDTLMNALVILLFVTGTYLMLGLVCVAIEQIPALAGARPRRARSQTSRTQRRTRSPRPRRRVGRPEDAASAAR